MEVTNQILTAYLSGHSAMIRKLSLYYFTQDMMLLDAALLPLQLTPIRAPSSHGVYSTAVASYTEGLLVVHSSLQSPTSIFLSSVRLPLAAMTIEADHGGNKYNIDSICVWTSYGDMHTMTI